MKIRALATPLAPREDPKIAALREHVGRDDFYLEVAKLDPASAAKWRQMAKTQATFKRAEAGYADPAARTYSESCRETLHRIAVQLLAQPNGQDLYDQFIELHPTLFKENGAYQLPLGDQLAILGHTEVAMLFGHGNPRLLTEGIEEEARWRPLVRQMSNQTRAARRAKGLPVTESGFA